MKSKYRQPNKKRFSLVKAGIILTGLIMVSFAFDSYLRPPILKMASYHARIYATKCVNDAMSAELSKQRVSYGDIINIKQKNNGDVSSIESDMHAINTLKVQVTDAIINEIISIDSQTLRIPLGTLVGNQFTMGLGPEIEITMMPVGYVQTGVYNQFISAGINQTLHRIMLETSIKILVITPGYRIETDTVTSYCLAETIIVGSVPEAYTNINGDEAPIISKINDYAADIN